MLRARLTVGLLPLLVLFLGVCLYAYRTSYELGTSAGDLLARSFRSIQVEQAMRETATHMRDALNVRNQAEAIEAAKVFADARSRFKRSVNDELLAQPSADRANLLNQLDEKFERFSRAGELALRAAPSDAFDLYRQAQTALFPVNRALDALREHDYLQIRLTQTRVEGRTQVALRWMLFAIAAAVLLFFFLAWRLASSLLRPIKAVTASATALGEGNLELVVPVTSRDELGQLAKSFNLMAAHLRTYREATIAKVLRTQRTMEATLTSTPDPVFVVSNDEHEMVRNPAAEQLAKTPDFEQGFPPALAEPLAEVLRTGEHYLPTDYRRVVTLHVAREDRHYLPRILAIGDKLTEFTGAALILQDVTKFRLLDDVKTNLVGTVSHELKTPLTSLRMAIYLLLEQNLGPVTSQQRDMLETARDDADRLLRIIDSLLDLTRLEAGVSALERHEIRVSDLVNAIAGEARTFVAAAGQTLAVALSPELAGMSIRVDADRLRHVFINLLTNASKYSPAGGVITLSAEAAPLNFVRFAVRDQGPGIPADHAARIFDRFFRAPGQREKPGVGLGLAIARDIVVAHGGSIACQSEPGRGSEFYFLVPR
jgi:signal transduction histidine kinase